MTEEQHAAFAAEVRDYLRRESREMYYIVITIVGTVIGIHWFGLWSLVPIVLVGIGAAGCGEVNR